MSNEMIFGVRTSASWDTETEPRDFQDVIIRKNPDGDAPIFALSTKLGKGEVSKAPRYDWFVERNDIVRIRLAAQVSASATTFTLKDYTDSVNFSDGRHLVPGTILMVDPAVTATTFTPELVRVTRGGRQATIDVERGVAGTTPGTIAADAYLTVISNSFSEGTGVPQAISRNPGQEYNYTQIWKTAAELTGTAAAVTPKTGDAWAREKLLASFRHSSAIEFSALFGRRSITFDASGKPHRTTGGIRELLTTNVRIFDTNDRMSISALSDFLAGLYKWSIPGINEDRVAYCGQSFLSEFNKAILADSSSMMERSRVVSVYGFKFTEFTHPWGNLYLKTHPLLSRHPNYTKSAFILAPTTIKWRYLKGRDTRFKDNIQNPGEDAVRGLWQTEGGFEFHHEEASGFIGNALAPAAT